MIYLDTHVVLWLYDGLIEKISAHGCQLINDHELIISPIVKLELTYLYEAKRIACDSQTIIDDLQDRLDLRTCNLSFETVINKAHSINWTRDPFDRLIVANALSKEILLLTKDRHIRQHCKLAFWE